MVSLRQLLGEQRKCRDRRPRLPSRLLTLSRPGPIKIPQRSIRTVLFCCRNREEIAGDRRNDAVATNTSALTRHAVFRRGRQRLWGRGECRLRRPRQKPRLFVLPRLPGFASPRNTLPKSCCGWRGSASLRYVDVSLVPEPSRGRVRQHRSRYRVYCAVHHRAGFGDADRAAGRRGMRPL